MDEHFILNTLNDLVEICKDGEQDFQLCAQHTTSDELRLRFIARATRCRGAATALQAHVVAYGGKGEAGVSGQGALQRTWLRLRCAVLSFDDRDWIEACKRAELQLLSRYGAAMEDIHLPEAVHATVERHYLALQQMHQQMRTLYTLIKAPRQASSYW